jgi:hypothetical protein
MKTLLRKIYNLLTYLKRTNCQHSDWKPTGMIDWECVDGCGAWSEGVKPKKYGR